MGCKFYKKIGQIVRSYFWKYKSIILFILINFSDSKCGYSKPTVLKVPFNESFKSAAFPDFQISKIFDLSLIPDFRAQLGKKFDWIENEKSGGVWRITHLINQVLKACEFSILFDLNDSNYRILGNSDRKHKVTS